jgi:hypothetical protein
MAAVITLTKNIEIRKRTPTMKHASSFQEELATERVSDQGIRKRYGTLDF